ncbi:sigma-70 family RNA polymerase sigma factor [Simiduia sp. 21SJ11W-1]|uniref:RNA polymerase sigma factor n=1 Tax=Simiduia sp. 21SJ11W-1 TaxID=2909669 RepID=UPI00209F3BE4|nr:sigma-70 family RNA polymerase sigma factor [Simiduia sp. 21SJ11W-1]UTA48949.1 sigma-70 family RNA polymerase sigma factor [Simiduia sp. 21SJ11W-1]
MSDSDELLLAAIVKGDQQAMERFYRRHAGALSAFLQRTLHNPADIAEVINTVMLEVWHKGASFQGEARVRTWLFSMARFKAIDALRAKRRHEDQEDISLHEDLSCDCDLFAAASASQDAASVRTCVDALKAKLKEVVWLAFFEEMPYTEIAEVMQIPTGTVKTRMMQAKNLLMRCLANQ